MTPTRSSTRRITIRDVAKLARVSLGTVSRVMNNNTAVGDEARERVLAAAQTLGYVPDPVAQSMRRQGTRVVGAIVTDVANPLFSSVISGVEELLNRSSYSLVVASSGASTAREQELLDVFRRRRLDGVIMTVAQDDHPPTASMIEALEMPVVLIERELPAAVDSVASDHYHGMLQATQYLLMLGHRRIGLITSTRLALPGRARFQAFIDAHSAANVKADPELMCFAGHTEDYGYEIAYRLLQRSRRPTAVIASAKPMVGVLRATRALDAAIPRDLSLISVGDTELAELHSPPLTTIRWDARKLGVTAAQILLSRCAGNPNQHRRVVLETEFVVRNSCAAPKSTR